MYLTRPLRPFVMMSILGTLALCVGACEEEVAVPKPRTYPRVEYPAKAYKSFGEGYCAFTFDMPAYATVERDTTFFEKRPESDCWFNLDVAALNAKLYCSYYAIANRQRFDELVQDAFAITQKHNLRASYIEEVQVNRPTDRVYGVVFNVEGPAASSYQFFLTDSTQHFLRGALYFNTQSRPDSLRPVITFMREDMKQLVETLRWR